MSVLSFLYLTLDFFLLFIVESCSRKTTSRKQQRAFECQCEDRHLNFSKAFLFFFLFIRESKETFSSVDVPLDVSLTNFRDVSRARAKPWIASVAFHSRKCRVCVFSSDKRSAIYFTIRHFDREKIRCFRGSIKTKKSFVKIDRLRRFVGFSTTESLCVLVCPIANPPIRKDAYVWSLLLLHIVIITIIIYLFSNIIIRLSRL